MNNIKKHVSFYPLGQTILVQLTVYTSNQSTFINIILCHLFLFSRKTGQSTVAKWHIKGVIILREYQIGSSTCIATNHSFINKQSNKGVKSTKALSALKPNTAFIQTLRHAQVHERITHSVTSKFYPVKFFTTHTHKSICIKRTRQVHITKSLPLLWF